MNTTHGRLTGGTIQARPRVSVFHAAAEPAGAAARVDLVELDPLIHERTRLAILTALSTTPGQERSFPDLRQALHLTDGNLLTHLRTLEQGGLVELVKTGAGRGSSTTVVLTPAGKRAFQGYLAQLEALIRTARREEDTHSV